MGLAQSTLPPTSPTAPPTVTATAQPVASVAAVPASHPAKVTYADGQLQVTADNSSLNQILREISRITGMKITGGVDDQRVFGVYGPAAPAQILGDLIQGTGSNMLLRETATAAPSELILTPREGIVTPPNPNAPGFEGRDSSDQSQQAPVPQPVAPPVHRVEYPPGLPGRGPVMDEGVQPPAQPTPTDSGPASPGGPLSPEQIYRQLQQLQKAQPQQ